MLIAERLWALMGRRSTTATGVDQLAAGLARLGITMPRPETLVTNDLAEKLAREAVTATQALHEARALVAEAQRERIAAEAAWREAARINAELEAASAAHAARFAELDSRAHTTELREREVEKALENVAALKSKYETKLAAIEALVKDISSS
jgi:predicted RNase H-like nuclease (RuvC/YqgF family)